jgi:release factor glutamine methyltransferase
MRPSEIVRVSAQFLEDHRVESPRETAEALLMHFLRTDRAGLYARTQGLDDRTAQLFARALFQRTRGVPLQHLTGEQQFMDLTLEVSPGVFVPRPETEGLVEAAVEVLVGMEEPVVVDVGTGTGAVALAIKHRRPDAKVFAVDISEEAVALAKANAARLGLDVDIRQGDMLLPLPVELLGGVDLVASNPPYVTEEEYESLPADVRVEPYEALVDDGNAFTRLIEAARAWLRPNGWLIMEIGAAQGNQVRVLLQPHAADVVVLPDLAGRDRVVRARMPGR